MAPRLVKPRTAFVLAGGAALGAMQVGMLRALYERGIVPDVLVGTSAGALNAAFVASRPQTVTTANQLARAWGGISRDEIFPMAIRTLLRGVSSRHDHLVPDHGLRGVVRRHLQLEALEQATIPLHLLTFDVLGGREVLLSRGPALDAVVAAASIPGVLPPVRWGDRHLVDGGVVNNTPISHAVELGAQRVYVLPTSAGPSPLERPHRGAVDAAVHALSLLVGGRLELDIARYAGEVELIVLPAVNSRRVQPTDFSQSRRLIADTFAGARAALAAPAAPRRAATSLPAELAA
ncbi:MAG: patatin-like phospholipase family protein [Solirubrobacterales bacterium]